MPTANNVLFVADWRQGISDATPAEYHDRTTSCQEAFYGTLKQSATDGYAMHTEDASVDRAFSDYVAKATDESLRSVV